MLAAREIRWAALNSPAAYAAQAPAGAEYLIYRGEMELAVKDYGAASDRILATAARYGGAVTDSKMAKTPDGVRSGYLTLRVPSRAFFTAWKELQGIGEIVPQSTAAQDASSDYISSASHIENLLKEQATLQGMLDDARAVQRSRGLGEAYKTMLRYRRPS